MPTATSPLVGISGLPLLLVFLKAMNFALQTLLTPTSDLIFSELKQSLTSRKLHNLFPHSGYHVTTEIFAQ
jgi:hypothetical protein